MVVRGNRQRPPVHSSAFSVSHTWCTYMRSWMLSGKQNSNPLVSSCMRSDPTMSASSSNDEQRVGRVLLVWVIVFGEPASQGSSVSALLSFSAACDVPVAFLKWS